MIQCSDSLGWVTWLWNVTYVRVVGDFPEPFPHQDRKETITTWFYIGGSEATAQDSYSIICKSGRTSLCWCWFAHAPNCSSLHYIFCHEQLVKSMQRNSTVSVATQQCTPKAGRKEGHEILLWRVWCCLVLGAMLQALSCFAKVLRWERNQLNNTSQNKDIEIRKYRKLWM